jgi:hypothetical protein
MTAPAFGTSPRPRPRQSPTAPIVSAVTSIATSSSGLLAALPAVHDDPQET